MFTLLNKAKDEIEKHNSSNTLIYKHFLIIGNYEEYKQEFASFTIYSWNNKVIGCVRSELYKDNLTQSIGCFRMDNEWFVDYETPGEWFSDCESLGENIKNFIDLLIRKIENEF